MGLVLQVRPHIHGMFCESGAPAGPGCSVQEIHSCPGVVPGLRTAYSCGSGAPLAAACPSSVEWGTLLNCGAARGLVTTDGSLLPHPPFVFQDCVIRDGC